MEIGLKTAITQLIPFLRSEINWHLDRTYHLPLIISHKCLKYLISSTAYMNTHMSGYGMEKVSGFIQRGLSTISLQVCDGLAHFGYHMELIQDSFMQFHVLQFQLYTKIRGVRYPSLLFHFSSILIYRLVFESSYSLRNAVTGSFFAAILAGMKPPIIVSTTLITPSVSA